MGASAQEEHLDVTAVLRGEPVADSVSWGPGAQGEAKEKENDAQPFWYPDLVVALCFQRNRLFLLQLEQELVRLLTQAPLGAVLKLPSLMEEYRELLAASCARFSVTLRTEPADEGSDSSLLVQSNSESLLPLPLAALLPCTWADEEPSSWSRRPAALRLKASYCEVTIGPKRSFRSFANAEDQSSDSEDSDDGDAGGGRGRMEAHAADAAAGGVECSVPKASEMVAEGGLRVNDLASRDHIVLVELAEDQDIAALPTSPGLLVWVPCLHGPLQRAWGVCRTTAQAARLREELAAKGLQAHSLARSACGMQEDSVGGLQVRVEEAERMGALALAQLGLAARPQEEENAKEENGNEDQAKSGKAADKEKGDDEADKDQRANASSEAEPATRVSADHGRCSQGLKKDDHEQEERRAEWQSGHWQDRRTWQDDKEWPLKKTWQEKKEWHQEMEWQKDKQRQEEKEWHNEKERWHEEKERHEEKEWHNQKEKWHEEKERQKEWQWRPKEWSSSSASGHDRSWQREPDEGSALTTASSSQRWDSGRQPEGEQWKWSGTWQGKPKQTGWWQHQAEEGREERSGKRWIWNDLDQDDPTRHEAESSDSRRNVRKPQINVAVFKRQVQEILAEDAAVPARPQQKDDKETSQSVEDTDVAARVCAQQPELATASPSPRQGASLPESPEQHQDEECSADAKQVEKKGAEAVLPVHDGTMGGDDTVASEGVQQSEVQASSPMPTKGDSTPESPERHRQDDPRRSHEAEDLDSAEVYAEVTEGDGCAPPSDVIESSSATVPPSQERRRVAVAAQRLLKASAGRRR